MRSTNCSSLFFFNTHVDVGLWLWAYLKCLLSSFTKEPMEIFFAIFASLGVIKCGKKKFWVGYGNKCCASSITYNSDIYECCNGGKIVEKVSMCGAKPYNKCRKICCQGQLYLKLTPCCSGRIYDKENELCCAGRVYNKKYKSCCNGQAYSKWYAIWLTRRYGIRCNWNTTSYVYVFHHLVGIRYTDKQKLKCNLTYWLMQTQFYKSVAWLIVVYVHYCD